jgi:hypothetical protein
MSTRDCTATGVGADTNMLPRKLSPSAANAESAARSREMDVPGGME